MNHNLNQPAFSLTRSAAAMTGLLGGAALIIVALGGGVAAGGSAAACLAAYLVALVPVRFSMMPGLAFVWTMMLRMALTLAGVVVLNRVALVNMHELALWTSCWYLLLLIVEVLMLTRHLSTIPALKEKAL